MTSEAQVITLPAGYLTPNTECSGKVTPGQASCLSGSLVSLLSFPGPPAVPPNHRLWSHLALEMLTGPQDMGAASRSQVKRMPCAHLFTLSLPVSWSPAQGPAAHHLLEAPCSPAPGEATQGTGPASAIP